MGVACRWTLRWQVALEKDVLVYSYFFRFSIRGLTHKMITFRNELSFHTDVFFLPVFYTNTSKDERQMHW